MQLQRPFGIVTPTVDGDVLAVLARADAEFTPPEVHALVGRHSEQGVRKVLRRLAVEGIVEHRRAGRAILYRLNREHLGAPAVIALGSLFETFVDRLSARIEAWSVQCLFAALFGSAVRGEMRPESDIDVFVVRASDVDADHDPWRMQVEELGRDVTSWTGNDARILEYSADDVRRGLRARDGVLDAVGAEGVRLAGPIRYLQREMRRDR